MCVFKHSSQCTLCNAFFFLIIPQKTLSLNFIILKKTARCKSSYLLQIKATGRVTLLRNLKTYYQQGSRNNRKKIFLLEEQQLWHAELTGKLFCLLPLLFLKKNPKHFFLQYLLKVTGQSTGISSMDAALDIVPDPFKKIKERCTFMDFHLWVDKIPAQQAERNVGRTEMICLLKRGLD